MSQDAIGSARRTIQVAAGNIRHKHLYVTKLLDILSKDCIGPAKKNG